MTTKERFCKLMAGDQTIDHGPVIEWATWWDKTIQAWEEEGMPKGMKPVFRRSTRKIPTF